MVTTSAFPMQEQQKSEWCWAAVTVSVEHFFAPTTTLTQCKFAAQQLGFTDCCSNGTSSVCNRQFSLTTALTRTSRLQAPPSFGALSFDSIKEAIDAGRPVCVRIIWDGDQNNAHFVIISGYQFSRSGVPQVQVEDPFFGPAMVDYVRFASSYRNRGQWERTYRV